VCWSDCAHRAPRSSRLTTNLQAHAPGSALAWSFPGPCSSVSSPRGDLKGHARPFVRPAMLHTRDPTESRLDSGPHLFSPRHSADQAHGRVGPPICRRVRWHIVTEAGPVWQSRGRVSRSAQRLRGFLAPCFESLPNVPLPTCPFRRLPIHRHHSGSLCWEDLVDSTSWCSMPSGSAEGSQRHALACSGHSMRRPTGSGPQSIAGLALQGTLTKTRGPQATRPDGGQMEEGDGMDGGHGVGGLVADPDPAARRLEGCRVASKFVRQNPGPACDHLPPPPPLGFHPPTLPRFPPLGQDLNRPPPQKPACGQIM
jgi:hypothetical protein